MNKTPNITSPNLPPAYFAKDHESRINELWQKSGAFKPSGKGETFSMLMPPPNANESLHVGHALVMSISDCMVRYARMNGRDTLWIPGTDHAGFETQVVYEKKLQKEDKSRFDFSPDQLRADIRNYVTKQQQTILAQIKRMGASCDWDSLFFTLDENIVNTVNATFKRMYEDKLLYRAQRLVNYCTKHGTSFSDLEVEYEDREGELVYIKYPIAGENNAFVTVATTRPETMLGDTAVAVHPSDVRFKHLIGKKAIVPLVNRLVPLVADKSVDPKFGTGAVKVTPAHSHADAEIAKLSKLDIIEVINTRGKMCGDIPSDLVGLKVADARREIIAKLHELNLIEKVVEHKHRVGVCYKCRTPIEILPMMQWWVDTKPLAKKALEALKNNQITVTPASSKKQLVRWLENIIDWNISRQIVWGIPIPAWYKSEKHETRNSKLETDSNNQIQNVSDFGFRISDFESDIKIQSDSPGEGWMQDTDTFDTWFSSSQLPYATLGYPLDPKFKQYFPTDTITTASDILFWWVARMIMMSLYVTGEVPFKHIYLHGLVLDADGKKMSKSKGNVTDPIQIMDQYGTDALRWAVVHGASAGQNFNMTLDRVIGGRNLANKIWNASRLVLLAQDQQLETRDSRPKTNSNDKNFKHSKLSIDSSFTRPSKHEERSGDIRHSSLSNDINKQIIADLNTLVAQVAKCFNSDQYGLATDLLYDFFWHRFCDQYLELAKDLVQNDEARAETVATLLLCLTTLLKLFHPFMPFVTEAVWQELVERKMVKEPLLILSAWPQ